MAVKKHQMSCCALCQMTCSNDDSIEDIEALINKTKEESKKTWIPEDRESGERAILVITSPNEGKLELRLRKLGFQLVSSINRRNGYPSGKLGMWLLNW